MADIRASTARMWEEHASGEDLVALLQTPGHGHTVMVEPEHPNLGSLRATFVRIDDARILKLRLRWTLGLNPLVQPKQGTELPVLIGPTARNCLRSSPDGTPLALRPFRSQQCA